jgi:hypothetical protein
MTSKSLFMHAFWEHCQPSAVRWPPAFCSVHLALLELHGSDQPMVPVNR